MTIEEHTLQNAQKVQATVNNASGPAAAERACALDNQRVLLLEFGFRHVDLNKDLADQRLKLKFRMSGITYWKSEPSKAAAGEGGQPCLSLKTEARAVFEGAGALDFELCKPGYLGPSSALARCRVPLKQALQSVDVGSTHANAWNLELVAAGNPNKVLGSLVVNVCIKTLKLQDAGGIRALKAVVVPALQTASTGNPSPFQLALEKAFIEKATKAQRNLQAAFGAATRALSEGHAKGSRKSEATESTILGSLTTGSLTTLATVREVPEDLDDECESTATPTECPSAQYPSTQPCE